MIKGKKTFSITMSLLIITILILTAISTNFSNTLAGTAESTVIRGIPEVTELGDPVTMSDVTGTNFSVAIVVEDVANLYGFDVQVNWTTDYIRYVTHQITYPWNSSQTPVPPSPYAGILYSPIIEVKNVVDESNHISGAEVGTMGWWAVSSMAPAPAFSGSGTVVIITFTLFYQPFDYEAPNGVNATIHFVYTMLSDPSGVPITRTVQDTVIHIWPRKFTYPPVPLVKITPPEYSAHSLGETFLYNVTIMGDGGTELSPFWDIAGVDVYMHFDSTFMNATSITVDPDGWFASFWPGGIITVVSEINNTAGYAHIAFVGLPNATDGSHTPPYGHGTLFTVTFTSTYLHTGYPPPTSAVYLKNSRYYVHRMVLDADSGLIDLTTPVGTQWHAINPSDYGEALSLDMWKDVNEDGKLSAGDDLVITDTNTGMWHKYEMKDLKGTLELTQQPYETIDDYVWATDAIAPDGLSNNHLPGKTAVDYNITYNNGYGHPYWTGNFSLTYPIDSVNSITVHYLPFTSKNYTEVLTEGVDYKVYPAENKIELLKPLDVNITNEHWIDGVNNTLNGWPRINYVASGIQSVYVKFPNGTERYARNEGFEVPPPGEWWYENSWPWELEGWWALGYKAKYNASDPSTWFVWPPGTEWWINYTAASYMTIDYNVVPDPTPYYVEFSGSYDEFLALGDPNGTSWKGIYPAYATYDYTVVSWTDTDSNGKISVGDYITLWTSAIGNRPYRIDRLATDITVDQIRTIDDTDMSSPYYGWEPIVQLAGFPHPDKSMSPWHSLDSSVGIPHRVENATYTTPFADKIPPEISEPIQTPPTSVEPYQNVTITVNVTDYETGVHNVTLWYSIDNGTTWTTENMTEISSGTYQAVIPGYGNCTWVAYKVVAYDNAGNNATKDNEGFYYKYHVIPEFSFFVILPLFMLITMVVIVLTKKRFAVKPKT